MHSGDFQKKAPGPAASFFVYNGTMPELDEEQRKVQEGARVRRWRRASAAVLVTGVIVLALLVVVLVLTRG
jgi:hypothetical protein